MQPTDDHPRRLVPDGQSQPASDGFARKSWIGSLSAAGWSDSSGFDLDSILTRSGILLHAIREALQRPGSTSIVIAVVRAPYFYPWWWPVVADMSVFHPLMGTGWELQIFLHCC